MLGHLLPLFSLIPYVLAQNDSYAPTNVSCPQDTSQLLRLTGSTASSNQSLSSGESDYVSARKSKIESNFQELLSNHSIGYSADEFDSSNWPTLGLAVSGGGFRAALYGAGVFTALDGRNQTSAEAGLGGFLQVATYASGLSGGSWFLGSWAIHDAPSPAQLALGSPDNDDLGWILENDLFVPDGVFGFFGDNQDYYDAIQDDVGDKREAGFNVSITDVWSRALSYHFAPGTTQDNFYDQDAAHGAGILWSDIRDTSSFQNHDMPFPIIVATLHTDDPVDPGAFNTIPLNHTVFEFNPFELGSYDPMLGAFVEVGYTGTSLISGTPVETGGDNCVNNYDQFAFAIGTSSSLFNAILHTASGIAQDSGFADVVLHILGNLGIDTDEDDSSYFALYPNAFQQVSSDSFGSSDTSELMLCDGGLNGENVPLNPLLASARGVDVIFAIDSSADTDDNWPNGTALITTQARQQVDELAGAYQVPPLPDSPEGFTSNGYNTRPTFFGCNESADAAALLVYMPNVPSEDGEYQTNTNTFKLQYDVDEATAFIENVQTNAFRGNADPGNRDEDFPSCLACAVMERARQRAGLERSSQCSSCFDTYCASNLEATESATEEEDSGASAQTLSVSAVIAAVALLVMV